MTYKEMTSEVDLNALFLKSIFHLMHMGKGPVLKLIKTRVSKEPVSLTLVSVNIKQRKQMDS